MQRMWRMSAIATCSAVVEDNGVLPVVATEFYRDNSPKFVRRRFGCSPILEYVRAIRSKYVAAGITVGFRVLLHPSFSHHRTGVGGGSECSNRLTSSWCGHQYSTADAEELVQPYLVGPGDKCHIGYISGARVPVK